MLGYHDPPIFVVIYPAEQILSLHRRIEVHTAVSVHQMSVLCGHDADCTKKYVIINMHVTMAANLSSHIKERVVLTNFGHLSCAQNCYKINHWVRYPNMS